MRHQRRVAIKVLREEIAESLGTDRFLQEIMVSAGLSHPHIVPLLDSGERSGALFYVMPAVEGETLRDRMTRVSPLPIADALRVTSQVGDALAYSHSREIIHRDVKPENVLLARSGHALVLDFGIARAIRDARNDRLTQTGFSLGTPAYMSPEQAAGERDVDARSDQYSLAMMCYEMLAGTTPFHAPSLELSLRKRFTERAPSVRAMRPEVAPEQDEALQRALATAPEDRFATIAEFLQALLRSRHEHAVTGEVASAPPVIAVLPLTSISSDPENQFLADGIAEEILGALAQLKALRVIGRSSSFAFRGDNYDVQKITDQLHATHVLSGSMRRSGARLRVSAQLVTTADRQVVWSERFDRELVDVFAIQDEIAAAVSAALRLVLVPSTTKPAHTPNLKAHELFLQARSLYLLGPARYAEARELIDRGMAMDPESIAGRSLLAGFLANTGIFGMAAPSDAFPKAKALAHQVLESGPNAFALYVLGLAAWLYDWDTRQARRLWEESLRLSERARALYATLLVFGGETAQAFREMAVALTEDPFDANNRQQHVDLFWYAPDDGRGARRGAAAGGAVSRVEPRAVAAREDPARDRAARRSAAVGPAVRGRTASQRHGVAGGDPRRARKGGRGARDPRRRAGPQRHGVRVAGEPGAHAHGARREGRWHSPSSTRRWRCAIRCSWCSARTRCSIRSGPTRGSTPT